jgi:hypothetical protein
LFARAKSILTAPKDSTLAKYKNTLSQYLLSKNQSKVESDSNKIPCSSSNWVGGSNRILWVDLKALSGIDIYIDINIICCI